MAAVLAEIYPVAIGLLTMEAAQRSCPLCGVSAFRRVLFVAVSWQVGADETPFQDRMLTDGETRRLKLSPFLKRYILKTFLRT